MIMSLHVMLCHLGSVEGESQENGEAGDGEHIIHAGGSYHQAGDTLHVQ